MEIEQQYIDRAKELIANRKAIADKRQAELHDQYNQKRIDKGLPIVEEKGYDHRHRFYDKKKAEKEASAEYQAALKLREEKSFKFMMRLAQDFQERAERIIQRKEQAKINAKARSARKYEARRAKMALIPKTVKPPKPVKEKKIRIPKVKIVKPPRVKVVKPVIEKMAKAPKKLIRVPKVNLSTPRRTFVARLPKTPKPIKLKVVKIKPVKVPKVKAVKVVAPKVKKLKRDDVRIVKNILTDQKIKIRQIDLSKTIKVFLDHKTEVYVKPGTDIEELKYKFEHRNDFKQRK